MFGTTDPVFSKSRQTAQWHRWRPGSRIRASWSPATEARRRLKAAKLDCTDAMVMDAVRQWLPPVVDQGAAEGIDSGEWPGGPDFGRRTI